MKDAANQPLGDAESLLDLARAFPPARLLLTATEFDLFSHVESGADTPTALAQAAGLHPRAVEQVMNGLAAHGLLRKEEEHIANTREGRRFLTRASPESILPRFAFQRLLWERWSRLSEALQSGRVDSLPDVMERPEAELREFLLALHRFAETQAPRVVAAAEIAPEGRLLDAGGGVGTYAIEFCRRNPRLRATVFELPQVVPLTREHIAAQGLSARITMQPGDFFTDPLLADGELPYDTILLSNIVHLHPPERNRVLLGRLAAALAPGGKLLIHDVLMEEDGVTPVYGAMLALTMLVMSDGGGTYSEATVRGWLAEVGLTSIRRVQVEEDIALLIAERSSGTKGKRG